MAVADAISASRDSSTPLGSPEDPEVVSTTAQPSSTGSSGLAASCTRAAAAGSLGTGANGVPLPSSTPASAANTPSGVPGTSRNLDMTHRAYGPPPDARLPADTIDGHGHPCPVDRRRPPRTLPAAISPVLVGTGAAAYLDGFVWWKALLALGVALALQIGVNYANDYSDGIRGTDENRVGPLRLVGSKVATPRAVKTAAFTCLGIGAALGIVLVCNDHVVAPRRRGGVAARRLVLHRRQEAVRLPGAR